MLIMTELSTSHQEYYLVADMGGTHTDIALWASSSLTSNPFNTSITQPLPSLIAFKRFLSKDFSHPKEVITTYLNDFITPPYLTHYFLALASPLHHDRVSYTNTSWQFSQQALRHTFSAPVTLFNDFEALAYSLPYLKEKDLVCLQHGHSPPRRFLYPNKREIISLLGPGTGLGSATIVQRPNHAPLILPSEGGQAFFTPVDEEEHAILAIIKREKKLWPKISHPFPLTWEEMLSGKRGIPRLIKAMSLLYNKTTHCKDAPTLNELITNEDPFAKKILDRYSLLLASACQALALHTGSQGGLYLAGGITPHFLTKMDYALFTQRFSQHSLMQTYLEAIPLYALIHPHPTLIGLQAASQL